MSTSLARVTAALQAAGSQAQAVEMVGGTRTAQEAADAAGCDVNQIVKSIIFAGASGQLYVFLTAGGNQVNGAQASALAGEELGRADAAAIRTVTGFAIGGVSPIGHLTPLPLWMDPILLTYQTVWAAAGTPRHMFAISPQELQAISGAVLGNFTA